MVESTRDDHKPGLSERVRSPRNQALAARIRVIVDKKLGVTTPEWIVSPRLKRLPQPSEC